MLAAVCRSGSIESDAKNICTTLAYIAENAVLQHLELALGFRASGLRSWV